MTYLIASPLWHREKIILDPTLAFVLMPFSEPWSGYVYEDILRPIIQSCGLSPMRADEMTGRNVIDDIWKGIASSRLVIADISCPNENVFYEIGLAHAIGKPVVLLTQSHDRIPFDFRAQRLILYSDNKPGYDTLAKDVPAHVNAILSAPAPDLDSTFSLLSGFIVKTAEITLQLDPDDLTSATISDDMLIRITRDNVVGVNKMIERSLKVTDFECNGDPLFNVYPSNVRLGSWLRYPWPEIGSTRQVRMSYRVSNAFGGQGSLWWYDIGTEVEKIVFRVVCPSDLITRAWVAREFQGTETECDFQAVRFGDHSELAGWELTVQNPELQYRYTVHWETKE